MISILTNVYVRTLLSFLARGSETRLPGKRKPGVESDVVDLIRALLRPS